MLYLGIDNSNIIENGTKKQQNLVKDYKEKSRTNLIRKQMILR